MTPLIPGHAVGWRVWQVCDWQGSLALRSVVWPRYWRPSDPMLSPAPRTDNRLGGHAYWTQNAAAAYARQWATVFPGCVFAVGQVGGTGRVLEHERGFRAERMHVLTVDRLYGGHELTAPILGRLRERYGVPATVEV